jgi:hypothetical protein
MAISRLIEKPWSSQLTQVRDSSNSTNKLTVTATLVNFSEDIMVFEAGGKLAFTGKTEDWFKEKKDHKNIDLPEEEPVKMINGDAEGEKPVAEELDDENERIRRQVGDSALWSYYFRAVGTTNLIIIVVLQLITLLGQNFPRMLIWSLK